MILLFDFLLKFKFRKVNSYMNHYFATYIDLIQSFGFITIFGLVIFIVRKFVLDNDKDNCIEAVKINVDG